jgi:DNA-binding transcriptional LysR family regulator
MNLNYLETYIEVVKFASLTRAARKLYLSQPAVTLQLKRLEQDMGCTLIKREKGKFTLTWEGKRFFRFAEYVCQEHHNLIMDIARVRQGVTGDLTLISTSTIGEFILPSILSEFKHNYPYIEINVIRAEALEVIEEIGKGKDIIGFCGRLPEKDDIETIKIGENNQVFIVYPGHPFTLKNEITLSDLVGETLIIRAPSSREELLKLGLDIENYQPKVIMGTPAGVVSAVESKLGIGLISRLTVTKSEAMGLIKVIKVKNFKAKRDLYCLYRKGSLISPITQDFVKFVQNYSRDRGLV